MKTQFKKPSTGFTLVELMIVVTIIAILAMLSIVGMSSMIEKGKKVQVLALIKDFQAGMTMFETDYQKGPMPATKKDEGYDTMYGDPGGLYTTEFVVSALAGEDKNFSYGAETFSAKEANPRQEAYIIFKSAPDKKCGVGLDGKLYDAWGGEMMIAINGMKSLDPADDFVDYAADAKSDRAIHTWGYGEYTETQPKEQSSVIWSYGKDKKKGKNGASYGAIVPYANSDDVISW